MNSYWDLPNFGSVPEEYQRAYIESMIRQLNEALDHMRAEGDLTTATLQLTNLPTTASGLRAGQVFNDNGTLKIVSGVINEAVTGEAATGSTGTVTVLTP